MAGFQEQGVIMYRVSFKNVQLFKKKTLGIGSYGKVCQAKCDDLHCAAKLIHETLFDPTTQHMVLPDKEHRLPIRRFEQECGYLNTVRHPNIVQCLGLLLVLSTTRSVTDGLKKAVRFHTCLTVFVTSNAIFD